MASCTMPIKDVGELVNALENAGELKRISAQVDPDLEIAEILRHVCKTCMQKDSAKDCT